MILVSAESAPCIHLYPYKRGIFAAVIYNFRGNVIFK